MVNFDFLTGVYIAISILLGYVVLNMFGFGSKNQFNVNGKVVLPAHPPFCLLAGLTLGSLRRFWSQEDQMAWAKPSLSN